MISAGVQTGQIAIENTAPSANAPQTEFARVARNLNDGNGKRIHPAHRKPSAISTGPSRIPHSRPKISAAKLPLRPGNEAEEDLNEDHGGDEGQDEDFARRENFATPPKYSSEIRSARPSTLGAVAYSWSRTSNSGTYVRASQILGRGDFYACLSRKRSRIDKPHQGDCHDQDANVDGQLHRCGLVGVAD